jgi:hypothetical protein
MSGIHTDLLPVRRIGVCLLWIYTGLLPVRRIGVCFLWIYTGLLQVRRIGVCFAVDSNRPVTGKTNWGLFCCGFKQACYR